MARLTISLSESRLRALEALADERGTTVESLIDEGLVRLGLPPAATDEETARVETSEDSSVFAIIQRAQRNAGMTAEQAMELAVRETREARRREK